MILNFFKVNRHVFFGLLSLVAVLMLETETGISKWLLLVPVLLATFVTMSLFDRFVLRKGINNG